MSSRVDASRLTLWLPVLIGMVTVSCGEEDDGPNQPPHVQITTAITDSATTSHRITFRWSGWDDDGIIDHYRYRVLGDPGGRLPPVRVAQPDGATPGDTEADTSWVRTPRPQVDLLLAATTPVEGSDPAQSGDWYTFEVVAMDDDAAASAPDRRFFNAVTVAPEVTIDSPTGPGTELVAEVPSFFNVRWIGRDEDTDRSDRKPAGYQLKLVGIPSAYESCPDAIDSVHAGRNLLIPADAIVTDPGDLTGETFLGDDWWPKQDVPHPDEVFSFEDIPGGTYALGVRAVDEANAITPDAAFACAGDETPGNVLKLAVDGNLPINPHLIMHNSESGAVWQFRVSGETPVIEVPARVTFQFTWTADASWYGHDVGGINWGFDIPDPGCELCEDDSGDGGWIGWGDHDGPFPITFREEDAGMEHRLYIKVRDDTMSPDRELFVIIRFQAFALPFDRTALWIDDFTLTGLSDCDHDAIIAPILEHAIQPHLALGEELDQWAGRRPAGPDGCQESSAPEQLRLSTLGRYKLIYWNVAHAGRGSVLGSVTPHPTGVARLNDDVLSLYVRSGGNVIVWGLDTIGALLGDYYPADTAMQPGPGTFLWDIVHFRARFDRAGRVGDDRMSPQCSGIVGVEATSTATGLGLPIGIPDPTGYDPSRTGLWHDLWMGEENPIGGSRATAALAEPPLHDARIDTLYDFISNSWSYGGCGPDCLEEVCGGPDLSPLEGQPLVMRFNDPTDDSWYGSSVAWGHGKFVWIGAPFHTFSNHTTDLQDMMRRLTDWVFD